MDRLWTPWRYDYITEKQPARRNGVPKALEGWPEANGLGCVFCNMIGSVAWAISEGMPALEAERAALILERGPTCFICLNAYPYSTGHVMIVPYAHVDSLLGVDERTSLELMMRMRAMEGRLRETYTPDGLNFGLNLGEAAGAGVADHLHMHALPRWLGDGNFMTTVAETRVLPESLDVTWEKLRR